MVRRRLRSVVAVGVGVAVAVAAVSQPAGAAALSTGTADSSGNYAECSVIYAAYPNDANLSSGYTLLSAAASTGVYAYLNGYEFKFTCATAEPNGSTYQVYMQVVAHSGVNTSGQTVAGYPAYYTGCTASLSAETCANTKEGDTGGTTGVGNIYSECITPSFFLTTGYTTASSTNRTLLDSYRCNNSGGNPWTCGFINTQSSVSAPPYGVNEPCAVTSQVLVNNSQYGTTGYTNPVSVPDYWTGQSTPSVTAPPTPAPTCSVSENVSNQQASFKSTGAAPAHASWLYSWSFGDGSAVGTTQNVVHSYSGETQPSGGWVATLTVTAYPSDTTYGAPSQGTCTATADFVSPSGSSPGGGGTPDTSTGGSAPPSSCDVWNLACYIEQAVGWLVVPNSSFFTAWSNFVTTMESKAPFCYVVGVVSFVSDFVNELHGAATTGEGAGNLAPNGLGVLGTEHVGGGLAVGGPANGLLDLVNAVQIVGFSVVVAFGAYKGLRRVIGEH